MLYGILLFLTKEPFISELHIKVFMNECSGFASKEFSVGDGEENG